MPSLTVIKVALAVVGLIIFGYGVRVEEPWLRWVGVGFVAVAWLLRVRNPPRGQGGPGKPGQT